MKLFIKRKPNEAPERNRYPYVWGVYLKEGSKGRLLHAAYKYKEIRDRLVGHRMNSEASLKLVADSYPTRIGENYKFIFECNDN